MKRTLRRFLVQQLPRRPGISWRKYKGVEKIKKVKLQTMQRQYELLQMEKSDTIFDYFTRILSLTTQMKGCREAVKDQLVVEKVHELRIKERSPDKNSDHALQAQSNKRNSVHFASKCKFNRGNGGTDAKARMAHGEDSKEEQMLLMVITKDENDKSD
ncbi:unnamed protein product [Lathyrus sativus]|nr:unnamed protein product [Lathyrus sativus]